VVTGQREGRDHCCGPNTQAGRVHQPVLVSIPSKSQLIATSSCLKAPRVPHRNDLTMSGHLDMGRGFGTDATRLAVRYGFREMGLHRIELHVLAYNERALAAYQRVGFVVEGRRRDAVFHDGRWHDEVLMAVLRSDPITPSPPEQ